jgi:hypothetical protein
MGQLWVNFRKSTPAAKAAAIAAPFKGTAKAVPLSKTVKLTHYPEYHV